MNATGAAVVVDGAAAYIDLISTLQVLRVEARTPLWLTSNGSCLDLLRSRSMSLGC